MKTKSIILILALALLVSTGTGFAYAKTTIVLGEQTWTGIKAKNAIVGTILEKLGYNVEYKTLIGAPLWEGLRNGDVDVWFGAWPSQKNTYEPLLEENEIVSLGDNLRGTVFCLWVPDYVWEEGVKSIGDLQKYPKKFDKTIFGGQTGGASTTYIQKGTNDNLYGLQGWNLITGSWPAMLSEAGVRIDHDEWVVCAGWSPHWMNYEWDIKYLADPKDMWEGECEEGHVWTAARKDLKKDLPNVYKFFSQVHTTLPMANEWIYAIDKQGVDKFELAESWIEDNIGIVEQWVWGVTDASGEERASVVLRNKF